MPFAVYRADNRAPEQIATTGFQARVPLDEVSARQLINRSLVDANTPLQLPKAHGNTIAEYFNATKQQPTLVGLPALYDQIRKETSGTTMHVSTSPSTGVGGFEHRKNLYQIELPVERMYAWEIDPSRKNRIVAAPRTISDLDETRSARDPATGIASSKPVLLTDTPTIDAARIIAISSPSGDGEVAFLTGIPKEWINRSRSLEHSGPWQAMPQAVAHAATGPTAQAAPLQPAHTSSTPPAAAGAPERQANDAHPYANPAHGFNTLYNQALSGIERLPVNANLSPSARGENAALLVDAARLASPPLERIDSVALGKNGGLFAIQGAQNDPASRHVLLDKPAALPAAQSPNPPPAQRSAPEPSGPQQSVNALRQMFESVQEPSAAAVPGPRRH
ncbi:XVIPCD domain-containing protein [Lysobacter antibioticus]|uniref:XVIPCD domain-containing protein n=1 Tax=Lysobacter antibioticus TaxID=84531 RepID=UPI001187553D|nr:XVIPCD domain-containing protein [Lysobacter antibioticus]